jgi:uncharacterized protein with ParB-like and HNH nuclease domain
MDPKVRAYVRQILIQQGYSEVDVNFGNSKPFSEGRLHRLWISATLGAQRRQLQVDVIQRGYQWEVLAITDLSDSDKDRIAR